MFPNPHVLVIYVAVCLPACVAAMIMMLQALLAALLALVTLMGAAVARTEPAEPPR